MKTVMFAGTVSWFGGPEDVDGVSSEEGLAFIYEYETHPHLFLADPPIDPDTGKECTGLARRLNPEVHYVACRWDYSITPKTMLARNDLMALVRNSATGEAVLAHPAAWGPSEEQTGRAADVSQQIMEDLGLETDQEVEVIYPIPIHHPSRMDNQRVIPHDEED